MVFCLLTIRGTRLTSTGLADFGFAAPSFKDRRHQRRALDELAEMNRRHARLHPRTSGFGSQD